MIRILLLIVFVTLLLLGCDNSTGHEPKDKPLYSKADFPIGVAVDSERLRKDAGYRDIVVHHFNSITPENGMKMDAVHPREGRFFWEEADYLVEFCAQYNKRLHGHVLVWHSQVPVWMEDYQGTDAEWESMLKGHVQTIVRRYSGEVSSWDVVNEAFADDGELRDTIWRHHIGGDYVAKCFRWAGDTDPEARLFYNDYSLPYNQSKLDAVLGMVDDFQHREPPVPIDGIGLQMHVTDSFPPMDSIREAMDKIRGRGLEVRFSELDISLNFLGIYTDLTEDMEQRQRERVFDLVDLYRGLPEDLRAGITVWGVSDADSWIRHHYHRMDWPLLFDEDYRPKPAFYGFMEALEY